MRLQVYAPHVYTLAFSGSQEAKDSVTKDLLQPSNESAREEADGYRAPRVVTAFGCDTTTSRFPRCVRWHDDCFRAFVDDGAHAQHGEQCADADHRRAALTVAKLSS